MPVRTMNHSPESADPVGGHDGDVPPYKPDTAKVRAALDAQLTALDEPSYDGPGGSRPCWTPA